MQIQNFDTTLTVVQYGYEGLCIRIEETISDYGYLLSLDLNQQQLHELYQYIKACVSDEPLDDVLQ